MPSPAPRADYADLFVHCQRLKFLRTKPFLEFFSSSAISRSMFDLWRQTAKVVMANATATSSQSHFPRSARTRVETGRLIAARIEATET